MNHPVLLSALSLVLTGAAQASFIDTFDGAALHPDWALSFSGDGTSITQTLSGGFLTVTSVSDPLSNNGVWGIATLRRSVAPIAGDFSSGITFDWNQGGSLAAIEGLVFRLLDSTNTVIASVGYQDAWISASGAYISTAGATAANTALNAVPFTGTLRGAISRTDGTITTSRNNSTVAIGASLAEIAAVEMEFRYFNFPNSFFGTVNVDQVSIVAVPEPASAAALGGAGALGLVLTRRRRR